ncbi:MAG: PAS domain S-box protein [Gammaproteobacteria bacterium]|nr:PAS domain S-box protein [Gammaproteobacteria bacterium]
MNQRRIASGRQRVYDPELKMESWIDCSGVIQEVNHATTVVSGYGRSELIGNHQDILRHPHMPGVVFEDLWRTLEEEGHWRGILKNRCKNGDYYWVDESIQPICEAGIVVGYHSIQCCPSQRQVDMVEGLYRHLEHR